MKLLAVLRQSWAKGKENGSITRRSVVTATVLVFLLYTSSVMMFFGGNFWLWSFSPELKRSYTSILVPSISWAVLSLTAAGASIVYDHHVRKVSWRQYLFWVTKKGILLLFLIGGFNSLTGLTGMYATIHVSQILQSALLSTGPIWTFLFAFVLFPSSQPKFHPFLLAVVLLICAGVGFALIPQVLDKADAGKYFSVPWTLIYLAATALFPLYNVLQGRFLNDFKNAGPSFILKMVMLAVETVVQLVLTVAYFPVDFSPFYGACSSPRESWENLVGSFRCIGHCEHNFVYLVIFVLEFWIRHVVFAYLNSYSPSVAAVTSMLTQPINAFFLLAIPSWNVYGSKNYWWFTLSCFLCLLSAMLLYVAWYIVHKQSDPSTTLITAVEFSIEDEELRACQQALDAAANVKPSAIDKEAADALVDDRSVSF